MKKYYIDYPRNFHNEFCIYSVETVAEKNLISAMIDRHAGNPDRDIHRITRKMALYMTAHNRKLKNADRYNPHGATRIAPLQEYADDRPAWLDPEPFDMPAPPRRAPEGLRE